MRLGKGGKEDKDGIKRLLELVTALKEGRADPQECIDEIEELAGPRFAPLAALVAADHDHDRHESGEITASEALAKAQGYADTYPAVPIFSLYCSYYAHKLGEEMDSLGYAGLYRLKCRQIDELTDFGRHQEWEKMMRPLFEKLEEEEELLCSAVYLDECGSHLINHFLVQEITEGLFRPDPGWRAAVLSRFDDLAPLLQNMLEDQLRLFSIASCEAPLGMDLLIALVGCLRSPGALPGLLGALTIFAGDCLNETLLALAKLGSRYPDDVSHELRIIAGDARWGEVRLAAVEALGLLRGVPGNVEFLLGMLAGWKQGTDTTTDNHLFRFLVHALLSTQEQEQARAVFTALENHREDLDDDTVAFTEDYLEHYEEIQLGPRLEEILEERSEDFLRYPPSELMRERRCTLTLQREEELALESEVNIPALDLETLEGLMRRGRNEPCDCGSGKKFKQCCLPLYMEMRESLRRGEEVKAQRTTSAMLYDDLRRYAALPSIRAERAYAISEFLGPLEREWFEGRNQKVGISEEDYFEDWFLLARPLEKSGMTVAQEMLQRNRDAYDPAPLALLNAMASSRYSVYEVQDLVPGSEILLRDIFRGEDVRIRERTASRQLVKWDLIATRVGEVGDHYEMMGASFLVPRNYLEPLETFVKRTSREMMKKRLVEDLDEFLQHEGHLIFHQVMELYRNEPRPVTITAEGDEFTWCRAVFDVADPEEVRRLLSAHPYIEDEGVDKGVRRFSWHLSREMEDELRQGEHMGPQNKSRTFSASPKGMTEEQWQAEIEQGNVMRSFGLLELRGKRLQFKAHSLPRLEAGKRELEKILRGVASHRADSIQDQEALLGEAWRDRGTKRGRADGPAPAVGEDIPPELLEKVFNETMERAYGNWLDEPIPYLGDKTPREAAKTAKGREKVNRLLKDYENRAERDKKEGKPAYDFSRFRRELDIW